MVVFLLFLAMRDSAIQLSATDCKQLGQLDLFGFVIFMGFYKQDQTNTLVFCHLPVTCQSESTKGEILTI
jgi:hypothetical protein